MRSFVIGGLAGAVAALASLADARAEAKPDLMGYFRAICEDTDAQPARAIAAMHGLGFKLIEQIPSVAAPYLPKDAQTFELEIGDDLYVAGAYVLTVKGVRMHGCAVSGDARNEGVFAALAALAGGGPPDPKRSSEDEHLRRETYQFRQTPNGRVPFVRQEQDGDAPVGFGAISILSLKDDISNTTISITRLIEPAKP